MCDLWSDESRIGSPVESSAPQLGNFTWKRSCTMVDAGTLRTPFSSY